MTRRVTSALLTPDEEVALAKGAQRGDGRARARLIEAGLRLAAIEARRHPECGLPLADLMQEGAIGLIRAVDRFDHRKGLRFSTYARWWIRKAILEATATQARAIRLPEYAVWQLARAAAARGRLRGELGREPTLAELAAETGARQDALADLLAQARATQVYPAGLATDAELAHVLARASCEEPDVFESAAARLEAATLWRLLAAAPSWDRCLLRLRFGLAGGEEHTAAEAAKLLGVSRQSVRARTNRCLARLAARYEAGEGEGRTS